MRANVLLLGTACAVWAGPAVVAAEEPAVVIQSAEDAWFVPLPFHARVRAAVSHYDINNVEVQTGGTWGVDGALPLGESLGAYAAYKLNQFDSEYQTFVSWGGYRQAADGGTFWQRLGAGLLYDWFSDSRGDDFEVAQLRYQAGYLFAANWAAGVRGSFGTEDEVNPVFYAPGASAGQTRLFEIHDSAGLFLSGYLGSTLVDFGVSWRDRITEDALEFGAVVRQPLAPNLFGYMDATYATHGSWLGLLGIEWRFGGPRTPVSAKGGADPKRKPWDDPTIATLFNSGEAKTFFGITQGFSAPPPSPPDAPPAPPAPDPVPPPDEEEPPPQL
jgi:hypothetical protein